MKIYVLFIEYEVIALVTTNRQAIIDRVKERGGLYAGDFVDVWEDDKNIMTYWKSEEFFKSFDTTE